MTHHADAARAAAAARAEAQDAEATAARATYRSCLVRGHADSAARCARASLAAYRAGDQKAAKEAAFNATVFLNLARAVGFGTAA